MALENKKLLFLSDYDFFKKIIKRNTTHQIDEDNIISEFNQLNFGDLVVHIDHGVGKFNRLTKKIMILNRSLLNFFIIIMINF